MTLEAQIGITLAAGVVGLIYLLLWWDKRDE